jgi:ABC-type phosphate transport system substrate-binding protein
MRKAVGTILLITGLFVLAARKDQAEPGSDLAVIVNKQTAVLGLTSRDLRGILLGQMEHWPNGQKVVVASLPIELPETKLLLKQICGMSEGDFKRYFMQLAFQGKSVSAPHILKSPAAVKALVGATPGALGVIPAHDVDSAVNVLALDGLNPGTPSYKLAISQQ